MRTLFLLLIALALRLDAQKPDLIVLQNADIFSGRRLETGEDVRELEGNVKFRQGNTTVWCDKATQFLTRNELELIGNVRILRDTVTLTAKKGRYFGNTKRADGEGNVRLKTPHIVLTADLGTYFMDEEKAFFQRNVKVVDSTSIIYAEQLTYFEKERRSEALLNVRIVNKSDNVTMFGNYLIHSDSTRYSRMTEQPRLLQIDTTDKGEIDTLAVKSMVMESFDDSSKRMIVKDSVVIVRGQLAARSGKVHYFRQDGRLELFDRPIVWYQENQVTGDTIQLQMKKNRLTSAFLRTRAFVLSQSDSAYPKRFNQLTGRLIRMYFADNKLRETYVEKNAMSLYFLYDDTTGNGANRTSGDVIHMIFNAGKPETITITKGIEGTYFPENLVEKDEHQYDLDGFLLRTDRPVFTTVFPKRPKL